MSIDEWKNIIKPRQISEPYILFYDFQLSNETTELVNQIAKNKGLRVIRVTDGVVEINKDKNYKVEAGTLDFISLVYYSDFIVSSSFHGVAFSILFNKQFIVRQVWNKERVNTLLKKLSIQSRAINDYAEYLSLDSIDYNKVNLILRNEIVKSHNFLDKYI